jgi:hypothetical protein
MPIVTMPDGTQVSFPDDMPADDIRRMITTKFPDAAKSAEPASQARASQEPTLSPYDAARTRWKDTLTKTFFTQPAADYAQLNREAREQMSEGASRLGRAFAPKVGPRVGPFPDEQAANVATGAAETALGAVNYAASPINAALRTVVGRPVEAATGIPKEYPEFAAGIALPIPKRIPAGGAAGRVAAPTVQELKTAASAGYESPTVTGVELKPGAMPKLANTIAMDLSKGRVNDITAPQVSKLIERAQQMPQNAVAVTVENLQALRTAIDDVSTPIKDATGKVTNGPEIRAAAIARKRIDDYLANVPKDDIVAGDPRAASEILTDARGNYAAAERAETINRKQFRAELRAAAANSGQNVSNTMRQRIADIVIDPAQRRGYSAPELALMDRIVRGGKVENTVRLAGNLLGGGGGLGALVTGSAGAYAAGPLGALAPVVGYGLKKLSNTMTARNIDKLNNAIRANSPLAKRIGNPLGQWGTAAQEFEVSPTARNFARLSVASRNLSTNMADAGIKMTPEQLMRSLQGPGSGGAKEEEQ